MSNLTTTSKLKRNKPNNSCLVCKQRKVKCDSKHPTCSNCLRRGDECIYKQQEKHDTKPKNRQNPTLRDTIHRMETELSKYKQMTEYWQKLAREPSFEVHYNNITAPPNNDYQPFSEKAYPLINRDVMMKCIRYFVNLSTFYFPNTDVTWNGDEAYFFWILLLNDNSIGMWHVDISFDEFLNHNKNCNISNITRMLEYAVMFLHGLSSLNESESEEVLKKLERIVHMLVFECEVTCRIEYADSMVYSLCWTATYYADQKRYGKMISTVVLAYQIITSFKTTINQGLIEMFYMNMMYITLVVQDLENWNALINTLDIKADQSPFLNLVIEGISILSGVRSGKLSPEGCELIMKRIEAAEHLMAKWEESTNSKTSSVYYRTMMLAIKSEVNRVQGLDKDSYDNIKKIAEVILNSNIEGLSHILASDLTLVSSDEKWALSDKVRQVLLEDFPNNEEVLSNYNEEEVYFNFISESIFKE